jgi:serine/threonine protein kinase
MEHSSEFCNEETLLRLFSDDENCDEQTPWAKSLLAHLEDCDQCRSRFEKIASTDQHWNKAKKWLHGCDSNGTLRTPTDSHVDNLPDKLNHDWTRSMAEQLLAPASHPEMLGRIGRYDVEKLVGSGGMGVVFKGYDSDLNRPVAIKVLAPYLAGNGAARQRFAREAKAAAAVVHDHVVPIHNVETNAACPYLVMRYVAGESLQSRIDRAGALEVCEILRISMQIASGLAAAHSHGLVHRDIKPPNILLEQGVERSWITDFGLARTADDASLTNSGVHAGTPQYMSPEQAKGEMVDSRSDLFSLGSTMYAMCTGRAPFRSETAYGSLRKIIESEPHSIRDLNPAIPDWLCKIIARLMAKDPNARFASAGELATLLAECLAHIQTPLQNPLPVSLRETTGFDQAAKIRGGRLTRIALLFVLLMVVGLVAWQFWGNSFQRSAVVNDPITGDDSPSIAPSISRDESATGQFLIRPSKEDAMLTKLASTMVGPIQASRVQDAMDILSEHIDAPVIWNRQNLAGSEERLSVATEINTPISARELLRIVCDSMDVAYIVREKSIEICSQEYALRNPVTRYYDLKQVLGSSQSVKQVINVVQSIVESGGDSQAIDAMPVSILGSVLVVRTTERNHVEIEQLLSILAESFGQSN